MRGRPRCPSFQECEPRFFAEGDGSDKLLAAKDVIDENHSARDRPPGEDDAGLTRSRKKFKNSLTDFS